MTPQGHLFLLLSNVGMHRAVVELQAALRRYSAMQALLMRMGIGKRRLINRRGDKVG